MCSEVVQNANFPLPSNEFKRIASGSLIIDFWILLEWEEVIDLLDNNILSTEEIKELWFELIGEIDTKIDLEAFKKFNKALDIAICIREE